MKRTNIFIKFAALATAATMVACTEEECVTEALTITGTIESPITKTALDGPDEGGVYKTVWKDDDAIAIFSGESQTSKFTEHKLLSGAGTNTGQFNATGISSNDMLAIYPASIAMSRNGILATINLPEVQKYVEGNIPENAYPMYGSHNNGTLKFVNVCSVLKIPMYGDVTVKSITFSPNSDRIKVSGKAVIDWSERVMTMYSPSYSYIKLDCGEGVKLTGTETDFHMVVPPFRYLDGFTLTITTDKGYVVKTLKSTITLDRSVLYPIEAFECKIDQSKDNIVFEDANFKTYMVANFDTDNDGEISYEEALNVTKIEVNTDNIESLSGLEHMINLVVLNCKGSHVYNGSIGKYEDGGILKSLDVSKNTKLINLNCSYNKITSLDVRNNVLLKELRCSDNKLRSLDISKNEQLSNFTIDNNLLTTIDISNNTKLEHIDVTNNQLNSIDVSQHVLLMGINCGGNNLTTIDVSKNAKLCYLWCPENNLTSIDVTNNSKLTNLRFNNNNISEIDLRNNPELDFLICYGNNISGLDLCNNTKLTLLDLGFNSIKAIDLRYCPKLERVYLQSNKLKSLDLDYCPNIQILQVENNYIESIDISALTTLELLFCSGNPLASLYVYDGQINQMEFMDIPSTTKIKVKGSEKPDEPEVWADKEFWHKSLAMKFTATWCGPCAIMANSMEKAIALYPNKIEEINIHNDADFPFGGYSGIASIFYVNSFPSVFVDFRSRVYNNDNAPSLLVEAVKETESNYPTKTGISFTSTVTGNTLDLDIKLYVKEKGDYKVTAVLLEDGLVAAQNGAGDNFVHNHTARIAISDITGDAFSTTINNMTVEKSYSVTLPSSYDKDNLRILVYVLKQYGSQTIIRTADYGDYYVDNATSGAIGTTKDLIFADGSANGGNEDTKDGGEITLK